MTTKHMRPPSQDPDFMRELYRALKEDEEHSALMCASALHEGRYRLGLLNAEYRHNGLLFMFLVERSEKTADSNPNPEGQVAYYGIPIRAVRGIKELLVAFGCDADDEHAIDRAFTPEQPLRGRAADLHIVRHFRKSTGTEFIRYVWSPRTATVPTRIREAYDRVLERDDYKLLVNVLRRNY